MGHFHQQLDPVSVEHLAIEILRQKHAALPGQDSCNIQQKHLLHNSHTHTAFSMQKTCMHFEDFPSLFRHCHELSHAEENEELPPDTVPLALRFWKLGTKQTATILCRF